MADFYADLTASGTDAGTSWINAFDNWTSLESWIKVNANAGDRIFIMGGQNYTATSTLSTSLNGSTTAFIYIIGVAAGTSAEPPTLSDHSFGSARPTFVMAANAFRLNDYWRTINLLVTTTSTAGFRADTRWLCYNCKVTNTSSGRPAIQNDNSFSYLINNECITNAGVCLQVGDGNVVINNYCHSVTATALTGIKTKNSCTITHNVIYDCTKAVDATIFDRVSFIGNSIDSCVDGIVVPGTAEFPGVFLNNNFSNITGVAAKFNFSGVTQPGNFFDFNNWYTNDKDMSWDNGTTEDNSIKGLNATAVDPAFTNASSDNFTLTAGSALRNAGMPLLHGIG